MIYIQLLLIIFFVSGCTQVIQDVDEIRHLMTSEKFKERSLPTPVPLRIWSKGHSLNDVVHVYIEGDGAAWSGRGRPSLNPTPKAPVALKLALSDKHANVIYLARPCQYISLPVAACHFSLWTSRRYSKEVVSYMHQQLMGAIKDDVPMVLIGFSGGANIALQLSRRLPNVQGVITVAGNLDNKEFSGYHNVPYVYSVNDSSLITELQDRPQLHIAGAKDKTVPPQLTKLMLKKNTQLPCIRFMVQAFVDHHGPWSIPWVEYDQLLNCNKKNAGN